MAGYEIATYALDIRGHGRSEGDRGHAMSWDDLIGDACAFHSMVKAAGTGEVVPLGHSVGGSILLSAILRGRLQPSRFVLSSPALRLKASPPAWKTRVGRGASRLSPTLSMHTDLNAEHLSRDPAVVTAYRNDPLVHDRMSARFYTEWQAANRDILERAGEVKIPFLASHGTDDRIIDPAGTEEFFSRAGSTNKQLKLYQGGFHEPYNDSNREEVYRDLAAWLSG
jgi:alpha-beta hydrolase superfamily lysophospholipase